MTTSPEAESTRLRAQISDMMAQVADNETKLRRAQERELTLLQADSLAGLLERMVAGLADSYGLDAVSLVLCDPEHEVRHLLISGGSPVDAFPGVIFVDAVLGMTPVYTSLRGPWLGAYNGADHQLLFPRGKAPASVALLPLLRQGKLMGSLNFGSADAQRFTRGLATDFLHHLSVIAAFAFENAVNRARLIRSGFTDVLTGCHNRRYLQTRLIEELARAQRKRQPLACLMLDVDWFKRINDTYGHPGGDTVLREIAQRIESQVRASDIAARFGGEEFVLLLPDTDMENAAALAERIRLSVRSSPISVLDKGAETVTLSVGVSMLLPPGRANDERENFKILGEALLSDADHALYRAKSAGRDRVEVAASVSRLALSP